MLGRLFDIQELEALHRLPTARVAERQEGEMASDDGAGEEEGVRELAVAFGVVEIGEGAIFAPPLISAHFPYLSLREKRGTERNILTGNRLIDP